MRKKPSSFMAMPIYVLQNTDILNQLTFGTFWGETVLFHIFQNELSFAQIQTGLSQTSISSSRHNHASDSHCNIYHQSQFETYLLHSSNESPWETTSMSSIHFLINSTFLTLLQTAHKVSATSSQSYFVHPLDFPSRLYLTQFFCHEQFHHLFILASECLDAATFCENPSQDPRIVQQTQT